MSLHLIFIETYKTMYIHEYNLTAVGNTKLKILKQVVDDANSPF